jgi:hypothetical protein
VINAPSHTPLSRLFGPAAFPSRTLTHEDALRKLEDIEQMAPSFLVLTTPSIITNNTLLLSATSFRTTLLFARTLIARHILVDQLEQAEHVDRSTALTACRYAVETTRLYSRLRHLGLIDSCSFTAVSHLTAAGHTLIASMRHDPDLSLEHRPDLLSIIDLLSRLSGRFSSAATAASLLQDLSQAMEARLDESVSRESVAIRVLARRMAKSPAVAAEAVPQSSAFAAGHTHGAPLEPNDLGGSSRDGTQASPSVDLGWTFPIEIAELASEPIQDPMSFLNDGLFSNSPFS